VRTHKAKLLERMPKDAVTGMVGIVTFLFTGSCDAAAHGEARRYVMESFGKLAGGERAIRQGFEAMDQCIASRKLLEPALRAFASGVKIPKPAKP
jgi:hypothetical protein